MKTSLNKLDKLQVLINAEKNKYNEAIRNNQRFEDVKVIYLKIKSLEKEANELMTQVNRLYKG